MPVVLRANGYKFWFYEADLDEPPHVHVGRDGKEAKFWLSPIRLARAVANSSMTVECKIAASMISAGQIILKGCRT